MKFKNDVYFVTTWDPSYDVNIDENQVDSISPGLVLLATILKENQFNARILDVNYTIQRSASGFFDSFDQQVELIVKELHSVPENSLIGFSSIAVGFHFTISVIRKLKKERKDLKVFVGGPHASAIPEEVLMFDRNILAVVTGEAEEAIVPFCEYLSSYNSDRELNFPNSIPNVWYVKNETIIHTELRRQNIDWSILPIPDYSLIHPLDRPKQDVFFVEGGRGCPFKCIYCSTSLYWRNMHQEPLLLRTLNEIENIIEENNSSANFQISNDLFLSSKARTTEIINTFKKSKYKFKWSCYARIDTLSLELLPELENIGLKLLYFGIETGSDSVQKKIKKNLKIDQVVEVLRCIKETTSINSHLCFMFGFYFEAFNDYLDTLRLLALCSLENLGSVTLAELRLMPGTEIYECRKEYLEVNSKFIGFNGENLGYKLSHEYREELLQADKGLFPLLYQDSYILKNENYKYVRNFCVFISYLKQVDCNYEFYKSTSDFIEFYTCLHNFFNDKYNGASIRCTKSDCLELFEIMSDRKLL